MTIDQAYKKAKMHGYKGRLYSAHGELLDPLYWAALGKALGWKTYENDEIDNRTWEGYMRRFIDHIIDGQSVASYFRKLK